MRIEEKIPGNAKIQRPITGRYLMLKSADAEIRVSGHGIDEVHLTKGESYDLGEYFSLKYVQIVNLSSALNNIILEVTQHSLRKAGQDDLQVDATATIEIANDNQHLPFVNIPANSAAIIAAANAGRKSLRVAVPYDAAGAVLLGKAGVSAAGGGLLEAGNVDYIDTTGAMHAFNPNAVAVKVYVMELNKI